MGTDFDGTGIEQLVTAIATGDTARTAELLEAEPGLVEQTLPDNGRTVLHHATDWPGHRPNVVETIRLLVAAGADPNAAWPHPDSPAVAETPLHWAASSNDVAAAEALLDAGAEIDALGGIFDGCTPYVESIIFEQYDAARLLLARGATPWLAGAAALGLTDELDQFFDERGRVRSDVGAMLHVDDPLPAQDMLDRAFQFACRAGHLEIAKLMLARGADPTARTPPGTSALDEATANGHTAVTEWLEALHEARPG